MGSKGSQESRKSNHESNIVGITPMGKRDLEAYQSNLTGPVAPQFFKGRNNPQKTGNVIVNT